MSCASAYIWSLSNTFQYQRILRTQEYVSCCTPVHANKSLSGNLRTPLPSCRHLHGNKDNCRWSIYREGKTGKQASYRDQSCVRTDKIHQCSYNDPAGTLYILRPLKGHGCMDKSLACCIFQICYKTCNTVLMEASLCSSCVAWHCECCAAKHD